MFDAQRLLGMMMGTGFGGRNRRFGAGPSGAGMGGGLGDIVGGLLGGRGGAGLGGQGTGGGLSTNMMGTIGGLAGLSGVGGKFGKAAGLAVLGATILNAMQNRDRRGADETRADPAAPALRQMDDGEATLLIRAMIAAANADGRIDADERRRILGTLADAGASGEERDFVERALNQPPSLDSLLPQVQGREIAQRVYAASALAITADTPAEKSYLRYLADRLGLDPDEAAELAGQVGVTSPAV